MKLSIIIPAYNEEKRIAPTLESYSEYFENLRKGKKLNYEILVVINNSTDKTREKVEGYLKKDKRLDFLDLSKGGKGYAVREGFSYSLKRKNDIIGFVDADMATKPEAFYDLVREINGYDGAIASRYMRGSRVRPKQNMKRIIVSRIYNVFMRALLFLPYRDTQCGAKVFKTKVIREIQPLLGMSKYAFDADILYACKKKGFKIKEVPTVWSHKKDEKINFASAGPWMALAIIRLRLLNSPFRDFIRIYDKLLSPIWRKKK